MKYVVDFEVTGIISCVVEADDNIQAIQRAEAMLELKADNAELDVDITEFSNTAVRRILQ